MDLKKAKSCGNCHYQECNTKKSKECILVYPYMYYSCSKHNEDIGNTGSEDFWIWACVCDDHLKEEIKFIEKFHFFWSGPFSQWHPSPFIINEIQYNCAEQYMMGMKAMLFGDTERFKMIMSAVDPWDQKRYGRMVTNFNIDVWNKYAKKIVYKGSMAKYTQNKELKELLLATKGTTLVEASPKDEIWGIGLRESDPLAKSRATWKGTNWLGEILTKVRDELEVKES